ncbi:MAG: hypothetical protein ABSB40_09300 [Nitrososphaeria archaeon]|jgi:hypothetical protein
MRVVERKLEGFNTKIVSINNLIIGIATDIGPRILYLASKNRPQKNLFAIYPKNEMKTIEGLWRVYGGHRLWSSPEAIPRSYSMDDKPVEIKIEKDSVTIHGNPEKENSIKKEITIKPFGNDGVQLVYQIQNIGRWPIKLGCWALSLMEGEGFVVVPIKASKVDKEGLLPDRHLAIWPYTNLEDKRLKLTDEYIYVMKKSEVKKAMKIGTMANPKWATCIVDGMAFVKEFPNMEGDYPDFGCNVEVYTNANTLEFETLSPLKTLEPSTSMEYTETWKILDIGKLEPKTDDIKNKLEPLLKK